MNSDKIVEKTPSKRKRTTAEKIAASYTKIYARLPHVGQQKSAKSNFQQISDSDERSPKKPRSPHGMNLWEEVTTPEIHAKGAQPVAMVEAAGENPESLKGKDNNENKSRAIAASEEPYDQLPQEPTTAGDPQEPPQMNANQEPSNIVRLSGRDIRLPRSPFLPFSILLPLLAFQLPRHNMQNIKFFYRHFLARNITRQTLVDRIRLYASDDLLRRIIETFNPSILRRIREMNQRRPGER